MSRYYMRHILKLRYDICIAFNAIDYNTTNKSTILQLGHLQMRWKLEIEC